MITYPRVSLLDTKEELEKALAEATWVGFAQYQGNRVQVYLCGPQPGATWKPTEKPEGPHVFPWPNENWWVKPFPGEGLPEASREVAHVLAWTRVRNIANSGPILLYRWRVDMGPEPFDYGWLFIGGGR